MGGIEVEETALPGVLVLRPTVHGDSRGWFKETFNAERYASAGIDAPFVQDNVSRSTQGTLRGLHLQEPHAQGKLVWAARGVVWDVAVDVRVGSPHFGRWVGVELDAEAHTQLWVPPGFAHGFCVVSDVAEFTYKCTDTYRPECERAIRWDDPAIGIDWPVSQPILSTRDQTAPLLADADPLPTYSG